MRKKVTLAFITNDQERKCSFKKRKKGLLKKLYELCTLCGVEGCCILYSQYESMPEVWPTREAVYVVLERFKAISPLERMTKTMDQESYNAMRVKKIHDQWYKIHKENKRKKLELYMFQVIAGKMTLDCFDLGDVADMNWAINRYLKDLEAQIDKLKGQIGEGSSNFTTDVIKASENVGFRVFGDGVNTPNNQLVIGNFIAGNNDVGDRKNNDDDGVESSSSSDDDDTDEDNDNETEDGEGN